MKKTNALIIIVTVIIVLIVGNFIVSRHPLRLDLTHNKIYTLSDSTKKVLKGLDDVVTIRGYFTENLPPAVQPLRRDVDDLLSEFKGAAGNRLQVEFVDPSASQMEEQKVAMLGIPPVQLNVVERDKQEVAKIYLGMVVMFGDKQQVIPVVGRMDNLEYELAQGIIKVSTKEAPKIAWWEPGRESVAAGEGFEFIRKAISRRYEVVEINEKNFSDITDKTFATLVLASPRKLSDDELFALDQYIMKGGHVIALMDRFSVGPMLNVEMIESNASDLVAHYGASVDDKILLDRSNAMAAFSGGVVTYHLPYPYWLDIRRGQYNTTDPIVSELESTVLPWTSPLVFAAAEKSKPEILASSTQYAIEKPAKDARLDPQSSGEAMKGGDKKVFPVMAKLTGPFETYFTAERKDSVKGRDILEKSGADAVIFLTGTSRWVMDRTLQTFPGNATLFENAVDALAMGDLLIGIRSRESTSRPIELLSDGVKTALKYTNVAVGPIIVLMIGMILFLIRRSKRKTIQMMYRNQS